MCYISILSITGVLVASVTALAEINISVERTDITQKPVQSETNLIAIPFPGTNNAALTAEFLIVEGTQDGVGGGLDKLHDGKVPIGENWLNEKTWGGSLGKLNPKTISIGKQENFFFNEGNFGGRLRIDFGRVIAIKELDTYSCNPGQRGPQVYKIYGSDGTAKLFNAKPRTGINPEKRGWRLLGKVDTRPNKQEKGGLYRVSITESTGAIGNFRYLLFDISRTDVNDTSSNTFYSEICVVQMK